MPARVAVLHWMTRGLGAASRAAMNVSTSAGVISLGEVRGMHSKGKEAPSTAALGHAAWETSFM